MTDSEREIRPDLTRRVVLRSAALSGVAIPLLAACGSDEPAADPDAGSGGDTGASDGGGGGEETPAASISTSEVPVGGGTIVGEQEVVVTQPTEGDFKGFSAICTHQGCLLAGVADGTINCECHGSKFSVEDGTVVNGPATEDLPPVQVSVEGDKITFS